MGKFVQSKSRRILNFFIFALTISIFTVLIVDKPGSASVRWIWPWGSNEATVIYTNPISDALAMTTCPTQLQNEQVDGETNSVNACITTGPKLKFGMYRNGNSYIPVLGNIREEKMYRLVGASCDLYDPCTYVPGADVLVTKQRLSLRLGESIVLFNNFSKRIRKIIDTNSLSPVYAFDNASPDYVYTNDPLKAWPVGGYSASENGDWLAIEIREKGIYVLNLHSRELRRISSMTLSYFTGMAPTTEMAISNDGLHVAVMGMNAYIQIFNIDDSCGESVTGAQMEIDYTIKAPCGLVPINTDKFIPHFFAAVHPRFNSDGGELTFYAMGRYGEQREVVLAAAGYEPFRLNFLALGDSYSSGEGETSDSYYQKGTNYNYEKCHLSARSYPYLTARILGISDIYAKSIACSGATTNDVIGWATDYQGQGDRFKAANLTSEQKTSALTEARENFIPGRILQAVFVEQYQPKIITIGIGGNDVGFMDKLKTCLGLDTCEWALTPEGREKTAVEIRGLFWTLLDTYTNLRRLSPQSTIYAVGYPKIIDPKGSCGVPLGLMFDRFERPFMDEGIKYINQVIAAAAKKAGVHYIDIEGSLGDQVLCGSKKPSAVNWIRTGDDIPFIKDYDFSKIIGSESFHPTPIGQDLISKVVAKAITDNSAADACSVSDIGCYNSVLPPWPDDYWLFGGVMHNYSYQHNVRFTSDKIGSINGKQKVINMPPSLFDPNVQVHAEIHSDSILLGTFQPNMDGGLIANINIPSDIPDGYHTIHLYGTSPSGEDVDYYDVVNTTPLPISGPPITATPLPRPNSKLNITITPDSNSHDGMMTSKKTSDDVLVSSRRGDYGVVAAVLGDSSIKTNRLSLNRSSFNLVRLAYSLGAIISVILMTIITYRIFKRRHGR